MSGGGPYPYAAGSRLSDDMACLRGASSMRQTRATRIGWLAVRCCTLLFVIVIGSEWLYKVRVFYQGEWWGVYVLACEAAMIAASLAVVRLSGYRLSWHWPFRARVQDLPIVQGWLLMNQLQEARLFRRLEESGCTMVFAFAVCFSSSAQGRPRQLRPR